MPIHSFSACPSCVSQLAPDSLFLSKQASKQANKTTHKILKFDGLSGGALLYFTKFFSPKAILLNLQNKSLGLVGINVANVEYWLLDTDGVRTRYGARYA